MGMAVEMNDKKSAKDVEAQKPGKADPVAEKSDTGEGGSNGIVVISIILGAIALYLIIVCAVFYIRARKPWNAYKAFTGYEEGKSWEQPTPTSCGGEMKRDGVSMEPCPMPLGSSWREMFQWRTLLFMKPDVNTMLPSFGRSAAGRE